MFNDKNEELKRLEDELLEEEYFQEQEDESDPDILDDEVLNELLYADMKAYNSDHTDLDPDELSDALMEPEEPPIHGLLLTTVLLLLGIFLVVCWWVIRYLGVF